MKIYEPYFRYSNTPNNKGWNIREYEITGETPSFWEYKGLDGFPRTIRKDNSAMFLVRQDAEIALLQTMKALVKDLQERLQYTQSAYDDLRKKF